MEIKASLSQTVYFGITDHFTRSILQQCHENKIVIGLILGEFKENIWKAHLVTELLLGKDFELDEGFVFQKMELMKKVFSNFEVIGWYAPKEIFSENWNENGERLKILHNRLNSICNESNIADNFLLALFFEDSTKSFIKLSINTLFPNFKEIQHEIVINQSEAISIESVFRESEGINMTYKKVFKSNFDSLSSLKQKLRKLLSILDEEEILKKSEEGRKLLFEIKDLMVRFPKDSNEECTEEISIQIFEQFLMVNYAFLRNSNNATKPKGIW